MKPEYSVQIVWSKEDAAYLAAPFELPGCIADGRTPEEALANLRVVIAEWIEVAKDEGRTVPKPMSREDFERVAENSQKQFRDQLQNELSSAVKGLLQQLAATDPQHGAFRGLGFSRPEFEPADSGRD